MTYPNIMDGMREIKREELQSRSIDELKNLKQFLIGEKRETINNSESLSPEKIAKSKLIDSCMALIYPHIQDNERQIMRQQFENKTILELKDIERFYSQESKRKNPKL